MERIDLNNFDKWLKAQRKSRKLSKKDLGDMCDVSPNTLSIYETRQKYPDYKTFIKILNGLGYSAMIDLHDLQDDNFIHADLCEECINYLNGECVLDECPYYTQDGKEKD